VYRETRQVASVNEKVSMSLVREGSRRALLRRRRAVGVGVVLAVIGATILLALSEEQGAALLSFYFLPIGVAAVMTGRLRGILYALLAVLLATAVVLSRGPDIVGVGGGDTQALGTFGLWASLLVLHAYLVGAVAERGGNRALVQGLGGDALAAIERERRRMGHDLHDGIAQSAATALMQTEILEARATDAQPDLGGDISALKETISYLLFEVRTMINHLRPPALGREEFETTLQRLVADFRNRTGVKTELSLEGDLSEHTDSMRICLYRVIQEALANVEQHADASHTRVGVQVTKNSVFLLISDDGVGFEVSEYESSCNGHFGLLGMRERVSHLAGEVSIDSARGQGTIIRAFIPGYRG